MKNIWIKTWSLSLSSLASLFQSRQRPKCKIILALTFILGLLPHVQGVSVWLEVRIIHRVLLARWSPVGHPGLVEGHEVDLTGRTTLSTWEEYLKHSSSGLFLITLYLKPTLSFLSHRNLSFCAFLCMNTPSKWPVSTLRISMALLPQPMICPVPM